jgi:hypothetical protein
LTPATFSAFVDFWKFSSDFYRFWKSLEAFAEKKVQQLSKTVDTSFQKVRHTLNVNGVQLYLLDGEQIWRNNKSLTTISSILNFF